MSQHHPSLTDQILTFIESTTFDDLPQEAVDKATAAVADCVGVTILGSRSEVGEAVLGALRAAGVLHGEHPLLGTAERSNLLDAALYNGAAAHALDFDDVNHPGPMHPSCHLVPALVGAASLAPASGADLVAAYVIGFELDAKLVRLLNPEHYARGWHTTSTLGVVAATAAAAKILRLERGQTEHALAIAASASSGLRGNIGSMTKPLHAGTAARSALLSVLMAQAGLTGREQIFDAPHGFIATFGEGRDLPWARIEELGTAWEITTDFGLGLKPWACCGEATAAVEGCLSIFEELGGATVEHVRVATNEHSTRILAYPEPKTVEQARFSLPFCVAAPLVLGSADPSVFTEKTLRNEQVQAMMARVEHVIHPVHGGEREYGAVVEATLDDGRVLVRDNPVVKGWSHRFLTEEERHDKFLTCLDGTLSAAAASDLFEGISALPGLPDARPLLDRLAALN